MIHVSSKFIQRKTETHTKRSRKWKGSCKKQKKSVSVYKTEQIKRCGQLMNCSDF